MTTDPEAIKRVGWLILWERIKTASSKKGMARGRVGLARFRKMVRA